MLALITLTMNLVATKAPQPDPKQLEVAAYIQTLEPKLSESRARRLSKLVVYWANYYGVEARLLTAIMKTESDFRSGLRSCWDVVRKGQVVVTCDYGIVQVNEVWIGIWKLDSNMLQNDDSYGIAVAARVLAWIKRYYGDDPEWYGRYNSAAPKHKAEYLGRLEPFLAMQ